MWSCEYLSCVQLKIKTNPDLYVHDVWIFQKQYLRIPSILFISLMDVYGKSGLVSDALAMGFGYQ